MNKTIEINNIKIGQGEAPYVIAELSGNHNGSIDKAIELIEIAAKSGAHAIKLQTYTADTLTIDCEEDDFLIKDGLWEGKKLYDLYSEAFTPWEWHEALFKKAEELGVTIFSTPFDESAVDFLEELNVPAYKVASFEMADIELVDYIAQKKKPIILSTGMATLEEIQETVAIINKYHNDLIILHCVSGYPTPHDQANLNTIIDLQKQFPENIIGLSDHTLGNAVAVTSIALGASVIEKHFIDSRQNEGPDSAFSMEPHELEALVEDTKNARAALGEASYNKKEVEKSSLKFRRSLYFVQDLKKGDTISRENMRRIRPGFGVAPKHYSEILGKSVTKDIKRGTAVKFEDIEGMD